MDHPDSLCILNPGALRTPRPGVPVRLPLGSPSLCPAAPAAAVLPPAGEGGLRPLASLLQVTSGSIT